MHLLHSTRRALRRLRPSPGLARLAVGLAAAGALLAGAAPPAHGAPMSFSQGLGFATGSQSLWGPGKTATSFGASGSASFKVPLGPTIGAGFDTGASTGTVRATLNGNLSASYDDTLAAPGQASIGVNFAGTTGTLKTDLGAHFNVTGSVHDIPFYGPWDPCIYCADYDLNTNISFTPTFGVQRTGSDSFAVAGVGPDIVVASAQVSLNANQTARFTPQALTGTMIYTHRDTGLTRSLDFSLSGLSMLSADLDLAGIWDFSFASLDIQDVFNSTIGANLSIDVSAVGLTKTFPFANVNLLNTPTFGLDFASLGTIAAFSITVVPEPGTLLLLVSGLAGLVAVGRKPPR